MLFLGGPRFVKTKVTGLKWWEQTSQCSLWASPEFASEFMGTHIHHFALTSMNTQELFG